MRRLIPALALSSVLCAPIAVGAIEYPLTVSPDGRNILDKGGHILFFHGESPWHLFARLTREETTLYLDDRKARGFDALLVALFVSAGYRTGSVLNAYGEAPFTGAAFQTPNEDYFAHVDWAMQEANARGFTLFVVPIYMGYNCGSQGWCQEMLAAGPTVMRQFGEWIGSRYVDQPNIVWVHAGDVDARRYPGAMEALQAAVDGIRTTDTVHLNSGHCERPKSAADCYALPWLQVNSTYAYAVVSTDQTSLQIKEDYQGSRPAIYLEGRYESDPISGLPDFTRLSGRSQSYWALLGGSQGEFYGHGRIWDFWTTSPSWQASLDSPGVQDMEIFNNLRLSRPWYLLEPDYAHTVITAGYGTLGGSNYVGAAVASDGSTAIAYLPVSTTVTVDMSMISGSTARAWWYDPTIRVDPVEVGTFPTSGARQFTSPSGQDWVLVVDDVARQFDPPGQGLMTGSRPVTWGRLKEWLR